MATCSATAWAAGNPEKQEEKTPPKRPDEDNDEGDPVSPVTGAVEIDQTDILIPCPGIPLRFSRSYLSNHDADIGAALGSGWWHNWEWRLERTVRIARRSCTVSLTAYRPSDSKALIGGEWVAVSGAVRIGGDNHNKESVWTGGGQEVQSVPISGDPVAGYRVFRDTPVSAQARLIAPDGQAYWFSGAVRQDGWTLADDGRYWAHDGLLDVPHIMPDAAMAHFELDSFRYETAPASGTVLEGAGTRYTFSDGALGRIEAPGGDGVAAERDGDGRIIRLAHSNGLALTLSYDGARLVRLDTPDPGFFMTYGYDAAGLLSEASRHTASGTGGDAYLYADGGHCLTNRVNAAGREYRYAYAPHPKGKGMACVFSELSGGYYRTGFSYDALYNSSTVTNWLTDTRFRHKVYTWDEAGHVTSIAVQPPVPGESAPLTRFSRTATGDYASETHVSASGDWLCIERLHDGRHNPTNIAFAINRKPSSAEGTTIGWDRFWAVPSRASDADGVSAAFGYDHTCRPVSVASFPAPDVSAVSSLAWSNSLPVSISDPCGRTVFLAYDGLGYLSRVTPPAGPSVSVSNDVLGFTRMVTLPGPVSDRMVVVGSDQAGRNQDVFYPDGLVSRLRHDARGNPTSHVSRAGHRTDMAWLPAASLGSVTRWLDEDTPVTVIYDYDLMFNTLAVTAPMGQVVERYALDDEDRVTAVTNLEGQVFSALYGAGGLPLSMTRFDGVAASNRWDHLGNLLETLHRLPDESIWHSVASYDWTTAGRLTAAANTAARTDYAYDGTGSEINETVSVSDASLVWSVTRALDLSGIETNTAIKIGNTAAWQVSRTLDAGGRTAGLMAGGADGSSAIAFSSGYCGWNGRLASFSNAVLTETREYDLLDNITNITYRVASGDILYSFSYHHDPDGLITQKVTSVEPVSSSASSILTNAYTYDGIGRLVSEQLLIPNSSSLTSFSYDLAGNRLSVSSGASAQAETYTHNRLDSVLHDAAGNVTNYTRGGIAYDLAWNTQGQLLAVHTNGASAESYIWGPLGRRMSTTDASGTVFHAYGGDECVADLDASGNPLRVYTWGDGIDNLLAVTVFSPGSTNTYYAVKDHLGSVHALVDSSGNIVAQYAYDAWGNLLSHFRTSELSNFPLRFLWQGREYSHATGLYNFRARWYDPVTGRWLSKDPIGLEGGLNLYVFCENDPVNNCDPYGENAKVAERVITAAVAGAIAIAIPVLRDLGEAVGSAMDSVKESIRNAREKIREKKEKRKKEAEERKKRKEHTKNARPSTKGKHEEGQARKQRDQERKKRLKENGGWGVIPPIWIPDWWPLYPEDPYREVCP